MKKIISIMLVLMICTTVYGDYNFEERLLGTARSHTDVYYDMVHSYDVNGISMSGLHTKNDLYYDLDVEQRRGVPRPTALSQARPTSTPQPTATPEPEPLPSFIPINGSSNKLKTLTYGDPNYWGKKVKYVLADKNGKDIIPVDTYREMAVLNESIIAYDGSKCVILNADGTLKEETDFKNFYTEDNVNNVIIVTKKIDNKTRYALIDEKMNFITDFDYEYMSFLSGTPYLNFRPARSYYNDPELYGLMDYSGEIVIPAEYSKNFHFLPQKKLIDFDYYDSDRNRHVGFFKDGLSKVVDFKGYSFQFLDDTNIYIESNDGDYIADTDGNLKTGLIDCVHYLGNRQMIIVSDKGRTDGYYKLIKYNGDVVLGPASLIRYYNDDLLIYWDLDKKMYSLVDYDGKHFADFAKIESYKVTSPYYIMTSFEGLKGIYGKDAKPLVPIKYKEIKEVGDYVIFTYPDGDLIDIYDKDFNFIKTFEGMIEEKNKSYFGIRNGKYAALDSDFNLTCDFIYDNLSPVLFLNIENSSAVYTTTVDGEKKYLDDKFNEVDLFDESRICYMSDFPHYQNSFISKIDDRTALVDYNTKQFVIPYSAGIKINTVKNGAFFADIGDTTYVFEGDGLIIAELPAESGSLYYSDGMYINDIRTVYDFTGRNVLGKSYPEIARTRYGKYICYSVDEYIKYLYSDVIDLAYNTDVRTYINGAEIPCYKVDGYPCVFAEDLDNYGFDINWDGYYYYLDLTWDGEFSPVEIPEKGENNTEFTNIYYNDITVCINGEKVDSYNTNGKMLIKAKDLEQFGLEVTFENQKTIFDIINQIKVYVNDERVKFDQQPIIVNDRTLVPLRAIFEALGATVDWEDETSTVTSVKDDTTISLQIGDNIMYVNGKGKELDVPAQLVNDRTLVPVRAISEAFGCTVEWDGDTNTVYVK